MKPKKLKQTEPAKSAQSAADQSTNQPRLRLEWVEAGTLTENPHNWRTHPPEQLAALNKSLRDDEIGWAGALLYNDRTQRLIDGHGRLKLADPKELVPVLRGDWSESAEKKILATLDPIAAMAGVDAAQLESLIDSVDLDQAPEYDALLKSLEAELSEDEPETVRLKPRRRGKASSDDAGDDTDGGAAVETQYKIVISCDSEAHQANLLERFNAEGLRVSAKTL